MGPYTHYPPIALGVRSSVTIDSCHCSGGNKVTVSGSGNASATIINSVNFVQDGTFRWTEIGADANAGSNNTVPLEYATAWIAESSNPDIGDGTLTMVYTRVGKQVTVQLHLEAGSGTTFGSGDWAFTLPFIANPDYGRQMGTAWMADTGSADWWGVASVAPNTNVLRINMSSGGTTNNGSDRVDASTPFTWASGDILDVTLTYLV